jgi:hypothetical protein
MLLLRDDFLLRMVHLQELLLLDQIIILWEALDRDWSK